MGRLRFLRRRPKTTPALRLNARPRPIYWGGTRIKRWGRLFGRRFKSACRGARARPAAGEPGRQRAAPVHPRPPAPSWTAITLV
ncbi:MAG: hypothetical protein DBY09_00505 [Selenomonadales bacterium]|nr:MAG: hypothetical protein DBY09_00505 [Selenomonadales bacterium]